MTCDTLLSHLPALADGELVPEAAAEAERHLAHCPSCTQAWADLTALRQIADAWTVDVPDISERVMHAVSRDVQTRLLEEIRLLRTGMQELQQEVAALRRQLLQRADLSIWSPPVRHEYSAMENDPWILTRS